MWWSFRVSFLSDVIDESPHERLYDLDSAAENDIGAPCLLFTAVLLCPVSVENVTHRARKREAQFLSGHSRVLRCDLLQTVHDPVKLTSQAWSEPRGQHQPARLVDLCATLLSRITDLFDQFSCGRVRDVHVRNDRGAVVEVGDGFDLLDGDATVSVGIFTVALEFFCKGLDVVVGFVTCGRVAEVTFESSVRVRVMVYSQLLVLQSFDLELDVLNSFLQIFNVLV